MPSLAYHVVDVFTDEPFAGNPLAVVLGGDDLTSAQCQVLAAEFNLSETAFPLRAEAAGADYRIRIFTPVTELPFAGHPSIGTAWVQRLVGAVAPDAVRIVQECGAGLLPLRYLTGGGVELTGGPPTVGVNLPAPGVAALLAGCAVSEAHLGGPVRISSCGVPYVVVPVAPGALARASPGVGLAEAIDATSRHGVLLAEWDPARLSAHVRMFAPGAGVLEDPATGSAAVALGAYLVSVGLLPPDGVSTFGVRQGAEIGRSSALAVTVVAHDGQAIECRVAGQVAPVAHGWVEVPGGGTT